MHYAMLKKKYTLLTIVPKRYYFLGIMQCISMGQNVAIKVDGMLTIISCSTKTLYGQEMLIYRHLRIYNLPLLMTMLHSGVNFVSCVG